MSQGFVPELGDFVWLNFDPQVGREQAGRRPALVVTPRDYNHKVGLALVCPVTSHAKGYPFEIPVLSGASVKGVILAEHINSLDWKARNAVHICNAPRGTILQVHAMLESLLEG